MSDQLLTDHEWRGVWWHPDEPGVVASGTLTFTPGDGLRIDLIGLTDYRGQFRGLLAGNGDKAHWGVLHGFDVDGREITLCEVTLVRSGPGQVVAQEMIVSQALIGCHLDSDHPGAFDRVNTSVEGLSVFASMPRADESAGRVEFALHKGEYSAQLSVSESSTVAYSVTGTSTEKVRQTHFSASSRLPKPADELIGLAEFVKVDEASGC